MPTNPLPIKGAVVNYNSAAVNLDKEEGAKEYGPGGYRPISIGDEIRRGRYLVVRKLGWGHFSTVWLVNDRRANVHVALKVVKSSPKYAQTARDEIALLNQISNAPNPNHPGRAHLVQFLDSFELKPDDGIPGSSTIHVTDYRHVCMTFEPLGENLLTLLRRLQSCDETNLKIGIPTVLVQQITRQMLQALDFLHQDCQLIHTDLKPENVMVVVDDVEELVRACAASEQMTGVSPSSASKIVTIPRSGGGRFDPGGGDWHNQQKNIHIFGSYPLPSPLQDWGRENAGAEVGSLALIMSQLAIESKKSVSLGITDPEIAGSGSSSFISVDSAATSFSSTDISTAPTSLESSIIGGVKLGAPWDEPSPTAVDDSAARREAEDRVSAHSDSTLNVLDEERTVAVSNPHRGVEPPSHSPTPKPTPTPHGFPTPTSLLTASAPPNKGSRGRSAFESSPSMPNLPATTPPPRIRIKIADMGNATPVNKHFTPDIQTRQYRCPEVILGYRDWGPSVDIWSVGAMVFELLTSDFLFAPEPKEHRYTKDDDHMAQIIELLGDLPAHRKFNGKWSRDIFNSNGQLRNISRLRPWSLKKVLMQKYDYPLKQATALRDFLVPMLALDPDDRPSAGELSRHPWLDMEDATPPYTTGMSMKDSIRPHPFEPEESKIHPPRLMEPTVEHPL